MKAFILFSISLLVALSLKYCKPVSHDVQPVKVLDSIVAEPTTWFFDTDSGYVTNGEILPFLIQEKVIDTVGLSSNYKNDTIGKYYSYGINQVILQITDFSNSENHDPEVLLVLENVNNNIHLVQRESYFHGNYDCCDAGYKSFVKYGSTYGIKICGTGSAYCSGNVYFFDKITSEIYSNYIPVYRYTANGYYTEYFGEISESKKDLIVTYQYESGLWSDNRIPDKKMKFKVRYTYSEKNGWQAKDSTYFKQYLDLN